MVAAVLEGDDFIDIDSISSGHTSFALKPFYLQSDKTVPQAVWWPVTHGWEARPFIIGEDSRGSCQPARRDLPRYTDAWERT